jgi:hypothetical protein
MLIGPVMFIEPMVARFDSVKRRSPRTGVGLGADAVGITLKYVFPLVKVAGDHDRS